MSFTKQISEANTVEVPMAGLGFTTNEKNILQTFVGSCVAICIYDSNTKTAGMAHVMLPKNNTNNPNPKPEGKFVDVAIKILLDKLVKDGANPKNLKAKMAGGADIFQNESKQNVFKIGQRNVDAIRVILEEKKIPIISEDVGSTSGRWISFDVNSSQMKIKDRIKGVMTI
jgi:chemotaxis protein CheD